MKHAQHRAEPEALPQPLLCNTSLQGTPDMRSEGQTEDAGPNVKRPNWELGDLVPALVLLVQSVTKRKSLWASYFLVHKMIG